MARRRTTLSQNFLHDPAAVRRMVLAARLRPDDLVVEPGAGAGALTRALAPRCRQVLAYEIDTRLAARLPHRLRDHPNVRTVHGDFLRAGPPSEPFAVAGNIPYARTSEIVRWCLAAPTMTSATLLTQLEYARKRAGGYGRWSRVTVASWPEYHWRLAGRVSRHSFTPVPRSDSAVLRIEHRGRPLLPREALPAYREFVAHGFTGVGGSLAATLARRHGTRRVRGAFTGIGLEVHAPVGFVPPQAWLELFRYLA